MTDKEAYALPKIAKMKEVIYDELAKHKDIVIFSGKDDTFAPNILTFGIKGVRGEVVVHAFEDTKFTFQPHQLVHQKLENLLEH